jgi:hypothetical protein
MDAFWPTDGHALRPLQFQPTRSACLSIVKSHPMFESTSIRMWQCLAYSKADIVSGFSTRSAYTLSVALLDNSCFPVLLLSPPFSLQHIPFRPLAVVSVLPKSSISSLNAGPSTTHTENEQCIFILGHCPPSFPPYRLRHQSTLPCTPTLP